MILPLLLLLLLLLPLLLLLLLLVHCSCLYTAPAPDTTDTALWLVCSHTINPLDIFVVDDGSIPSSAAGLIAAMIHIKVHLNDGESRREEAGVSGVAGRVETATLSTLLLESVREFQKIRATGR